MHQRSKISVAAALALTAVASFAQAQAPAPTQQIERIEITGSRIRQIDAETAQPVFKMTQADIKKTGLVTVGDIISQMTASGSPSFSKGSVLSGGRDIGGQFANMRNLGPQRVLVLVNGKRWSQSVNGYTDYSTVPSSMIDRIEILKDGASSTYGSDAIAGVVNIVLKKTMDGGEASAYYGQNAKGDGKTSDYSFSFGTSTEKASLMFGFTYNKVDPTWSKDRDITSYTYGPDHPTAGYGTAPWGRIRAVNPVNGQATGMNMILNHTGGPLGDGTGQDSRNPANYHAYAGAENDTFNSTSQMMFQAGSELKSIFTRGTLELSDTVRFGATAMFADRNSARTVAGYPLNSLSQLAFPVYIDKNSYFNPYGEQVAGAGKGQDLFFYRRTIEVPRTSNNNNKTFHLDGGLEGDLTIAGQAWNWSTGVNYSKVDGNTTGTGNLNLFNLKKAVGPSFKNAAGVIQCGTAAAPIAGCVPFDILGGPSASSQAALDYVMSKGSALYSSEVTSVMADASGELFKLPAGAVALAVGVEHRKVKGSDNPGQFEQTGQSTDLVGYDTKGEFTVKEAYAELNVPILKGVFLAEALNLNLATRHSDYSNFGKTTNSKFSFTWKPIKDLLTRGTVAEGFRAPSLGDNFGGGSQSFDSYLDPCDSQWGAVKNDAKVKAACAAAGVPVNFRQKNQAGTAVAGGGAQTPFPFQTGAGNDSLTPETAKTKTLGVVFSPSALQGLTVSMDWYNITVKDRIVTNTTPYVLNQCYVQGVQTFCAAVTRDAGTGQIVALSRGNANRGYLETSGVDLGVNYKFPSTPFGQFTLRTESTYLASFKSRATTDAEWQEVAGDYDYNRFKSNINIDWSKGDWSINFGTRYYSAVKTNCWDTDDTTTCSNPTDTWSGGTGYNKPSALIYNDLNVSYKTPWKGTLTIGANNVFNVKPRVVLDANSNYGGNSSSASVDPDMPLDRFFWVRYNQAF
ncbi:TonB-dependent receptor [Paucibacter sp. AS339]|uniref:TonB-dependent receptor plug domain-containing protein n=1 Tax=Paucibacter hankyongi TaxID=3133434 RepID=UPI0030B632AA